ncbi:MAG: hypothetical protein IJR59_06940 [Firmicutes bacterium]|nr:hypothetical protein [Bacillota bacterium]
MKKCGYEVKISDRLYFKGESDTNFRRSDTMGDAYSIVGIKQRLQGIDVPRIMITGIRQKRNCASMRF